MATKPNPYAPKPMSEDKPMKPMKPKAPMTMPSPYKSKK